MRNLVDKESIAQVLGSVIKKPSIMEETGIELWREDFPELFHRIVYATVYNLYLDGVGQIDSIAIDSYLSKYPKQYATFSENNGIEYVETIIEQAVLENFEYNFNRVRKFTMLRRCKEIGIDTTEVYDDTILGQTEHEEMRAKFDSMELKDIANLLSSKFMEIEDEFLSDEKNTEQHAGLGMRDLKERLKMEPEYGSPLNGQIFNSILRGARRKKLYLRSAPTGIGKCLVGATLINTDKGLIPIEDIPKFYEIGAQGEAEAKIISYDVGKGEKKILPTSHWYNMGHSKTVKITTKKGYEIEGTFEHPIVTSEANGDYDFKRLENVSKDDLVAISVNNQLFGKLETDLELAYLMGVLIGDGYLNNSNDRTNVSYSNMDKNIVKEVNRIIQGKLNGVTNIRSYQRKDTKGIDHEFGNMKTRKQLEELGVSMCLSKDKHIPQSVMMGTKEVVQAFLRGLFDTDGSMTNGRFEFSSASERLAREVHILLNNFGIVATKRKKPVNGEVYHIVTITDYKNMKIFYKEVGFLNELDKKEKLKERINEENSMNSNVDFVLNRGSLELLHIYLKENDINYKYNRKKALSYKRNGLGFYESMKNNRRISRERILAIMEGLDFDSLPAELQKLYNTANNIFFDEILSIEHSEATVYDFTVPETHSFVANGFISHNTRLSIGDSMHIGLSEMYNTETKEWEKIGVGEPVLFITTELEEDEIQTMMMAYASGVNEDIILDGSYRGDEEERVDRAVQLIEESNIRIAYLPDFDIEEVERVIKKHIMNYGIRHIFFDYNIVEIKPNEPINIGCVFYEW